MVRLLSSYWNKFIDVDINGNKKGNGTKFEDLVEYILLAMYGKRWKRTGGSHDDNRDFWIHLAEESIWAECKNYTDTIAMNILAPTLVMAQVYEINEILFFSRSNINRYAKDKILAFGEKSNKKIRFFDGENLDNLVCIYSAYFPRKYSPLQYMNNCNSQNTTPFCVNLYFFQNIISSMHNSSEVFKNYELAENIYYNETFALTFCLENNCGEDDVEVFIEFIEEGKERFSFQYFYPGIVPENKLWYHSYLKKGEGKSVTLNMRQIIYEPKVMLPRFRITFVTTHSSKPYEWISKEVVVKSSWVGLTRLIGKNYLKIIKDTDEQLVNNPFLSGLIITGSSGTGKTRILTECQNIFLKKGYRIVSLTGLENFSSHCFIKELISYLYEIPGNELMSLLEEKIFSANSEHEGTLNTDFEKAICLLRIIMNTKTDDELQETLDAYEKILFEKLSNDKNVLVIDNLQFAGKAFQNFIEKYVYYGVNQQTPNQSIIVTVFNTDYMTANSSELLYNLLHANIKHCISTTLEGFKEKEHGILFLQELTRTNKDENSKYFLEIINKVSLKPYNLFQTTKYLEESGVIKISPDKKGYIISNFKKYEVLSEISNGITDVIEKRLDFIRKYISQDRLMLIFSVMYIFDYIDIKIEQIFKISISELEILCKKNILRLQFAGRYIFDHDIIRNFFLEKYSEHILDSLLYIEKEGLVDSIKKYRIAYLLFKIVYEKDTDTIINQGKNIAYLNLPERIASLYYNCLLDAFVELLDNHNYTGIYIKYIHSISTYIRQYDGSQKAWYRSKEAYYTIQAHYPQALSNDIIFYRPFIHFCCDISMQTHIYEEGIVFINDVLEACQNVHTDSFEDQDEVNVLQAIMYNRWYIAYNTKSYKKEIELKRQQLMEKSRLYEKKIINSQKRGLIEYLNNSDEGYNYYGYQEDKNKLFSIWNKCIIDIPKLVPEKTLNYYRKTVQYALIEYDLDRVKEETTKAMEYLESGKYSHEPIIFKTFFLMAEVMSNLQHKPNKLYYYNVDIINDILKMQQLLDNHKIGDILLLKGVNAYYGENTDEVYYSFKEAYKHYAAGETSRYWIKKDLLEENIQYTFTMLRIYTKGYDVNFLAEKYRQPLTICESKNFIASGIQRTGDLHLNLPLI